MNILQLNARRVGGLAAAILGLTAAARAAEITTLAPVEVTSSPASRLGVSDAASEGRVPRDQLNARPAYRPGELLESTPGLIVTQHSGEGKANQYFLRGINLDHGTDLATTIDGMPVNQRTHGHGQGYTDLNFLIPEVISDLRYRKGPYYADEGDFSAAGAVHISLPNRLEHGIAELGAGAYGYGRALIANSPAFGNGHLLYALELQRSDGPWTHPDDFRKFNGLLRYSEGTVRNGASITAMAYRGRWNATNQIPQRALALGLINRFDSLDTSDGGDSSRFSLSGAWNRTGRNTATAISAYVIHSRLNLWSNFAFLDDANNSAQIEQGDKRITTGFDGRHRWTTEGSDVEHTVGVQVRNDHINVGLFNSDRRQRYATVRDDRADEASIAAYYQNSVGWTDWFRTIAGLRADAYRGSVSSDTPANSGKAGANQISPKISLVFGPWSRTEYYLNAGRGFRSNDLRGAISTVDPLNPGNPATREPLLVGVRGYETGVRTEFFTNLESTLSLYRLDFDSELLFQGDSGTTRDTGRGSQRVGFEFSNLYRPKPWLLLDADIAFARARYTTADPAGNRIPGAVEGVASFTATVDAHGPWYGSMRLRYFGPRPLIEDNTVRSAATTLLSSRIGYRFDKKLQIQIDAFNLLNRRSSQIDYYYASRFLPGDPAGGVNSIHTHPVEPRSFRIALISRF